MNDSTTETHTRARASVPGRRQNGPPLSIPCLFLVVLTIAAALLGSAGPRPADRASAVAAYNVNHHGLLIALATIVSATSIPLAIWTAVVYQRLRRLGVSAPGAAMAFAGGLLASGSISLSGILIWVQAQSADRAEPALARALAQLAFGTGGPGFVVPLALLVAGVSVPALILGLLPRPLAVAGLALAVVGLLVTFTLVLPGLYLLIPVARFGIVIWLIVVSVRMPRVRPPARPAAGTDTAGADTAGADSAAVTA